jgi:dinuclear metal center YbgI/SA1388 family protein
MELVEFVGLLDRLAPPELAEEWDNVGLLLAPSRSRPIERVLLTIDLTEAVLDEALEQHVEAIVAYHPPIFTKLKRLVPDDARQRVLLRAIEQGLVVYSPHTALDAVSGGVNDWLAAAFESSSKRAILPRGDAEGVGQGRFVELAEPIALDLIVARVKAHLGIAAVRVAASARHAEGGPIGSVSLCAGAGGSVLSEAPADLYLTGEMRHHDVLAAVERGSSVILCEHTNSERGYLAHFAELLQDQGLAVRVSKRDRDPLELR